MVFQGSFMVFHGFRLVSMVFQGGFMVFHGFWLVSMVFLGGFMVFHGFWLVPMVFQDGLMVFHVFCWFPWFCRRWEHPKMDPPKLYPGPTIQSRPAARRAAKGLVLTKVEIFRTTPASSYESMIRDMQSSVQRFSKWFWWQLLLVDTTDLCAGDDAVVEIVTSLLVFVWYPRLRKRLFRKFVPTWNDNSHL